MLSAKRMNRIYLPHYHSLKQMILLELHLLQLQDQVVAPSDKTIKHIYEDQITKGIITQILKELYQL